MEIINKGPDAYVLAGNLYKKAGWSPLWSQRYHVLTPTHLKYYMSDDVPLLGEARGAISLDTITAVEDAPDEACFLLVTPTKQRLLKASSEREALMWKRTLRAMIGKVQTRRAKQHQKGQLLSSPKSSSSSGATVSVLATEQKLKEKELAKRQYQDKGSKDEPKLLPSATLPLIIEGDDSEGDERDSGSGEGPRPAKLKFPPTPRIHPPPDLASPSSPLLLPGIPPPQPPKRSTSGGAATTMLSPPTTPSAVKRKDGVQPIAPLSIEGTRKDVPQKEFTLTRDEDERPVLSRPLSARTVAQYEKEKEREKDQKGEKEKEPAWVRERPIRERERDRDSYPHRESRASGLLSGEEEGEGEDALDHQQDHDEDDDQDVESIEFVRVGGEENMGGSEGDGTGGEMVHSNLPWNAEVSLGFIPKGGVVTVHLPENLTLQIDRRELTAPKGRQWFKVTDLYRQTQVLVRWRVVTHSLSPSLVMSLPISDLFNFMLCLFWVALTTLSGHVLPGAAWRRSIAASVGSEISPKGRGTLLLLDIISVAMMVILLVDLVRKLITRRKEWFVTFQDLREFDTKEVLATTAQFEQFDRDSNIVSTPIARSPAPVARHPAPWGSWEEADPKLVTVSAPGQTISGQKIPATEYLFELSHVDIFAVDYKMFHISALQDSFVRKHNAHKSRAQTNTTKAKSANSPDEAGVTAGVGLSSSEGNSTSRRGSTSSEDKENSINASSSSAKNVNSSEPEGAGDPWPMFVVNFQTAGGGHRGRQFTNVVLYFTRRKIVPNTVSASAISAFNRMFNRFVHGSDEFRTNKFRILPAVPDGSWVAKKAISSAIGTKKGLAKTVFTDPARTYVEIDVDVTSNRIAQRVFGLVRGFSKSMMLDLSFGFDDGDAPELSQCLLGGVRLCNIDPSKISDFRCGGAFSGGEDDLSDLDSRPEREARLRERKRLINKGNKLNRLASFVEGGDHDVEDDRPVLGAPGVVHKEVWGSWTESPPPQLPLTNSSGSTAELHFPYRLVHVDMFATEHKLYHVAARSDSYIQTQHMPLRAAHKRSHSRQIHPAFSAPVLCVNFQYPGASSHVFNTLAVYFVREVGHTESARAVAILDRLMDRFIDGSDKYRTRMFKIVPGIPQGSWLVQRTVRQGIFHRKLAHKYYTDLNRNYIEIDIDVGSSKVAKRVLNMVKGHAKHITVELLFGFEGDETFELPQPWLGGVRLTSTDLSKVPVKESQPQAASLPKETAPQPPLPASSTSTAEKDKEDAKQATKAAPPLITAATSGTAPSASAAPGPEGVLPDGEFDNFEFMLSSVDPGVTGRSLKPPCDPEELVNPSLYDGKQQRKTPWGAYCEADYTNLKIRSATYLADRVKEPAGCYLFRLAHCEMVQCTQKILHFSQRPDSYAQRRLPAHIRKRNLELELAANSETDSDSGGERYFSPKRTLLVINFCYPAGSTEYNLILNFERLDAKDVPDTNGLEAFETLYNRFINGSEEYRTSRFKMIPCIPEGSWLVKRTVGTTPAIMGNKLTQSYFNDPLKTYLEITVDVASSKVGGGILNMVKGASTSVLIDLNFLLEGQDPDELPERLIGGLRIIYPDLAKCKLIPPYHHPTASSSKHNRSASAAVDGTMLASPNFLSSGEE